MSTAPFVSVVLCTYNGSAFIDEQVKSVVEQDYGNKELVIVDDSSTDDTFAKLKKWQQQSSVIRLYRNEENIGYNKNFEKAIQLAAGDFIALSDQDDIWLPQKLSKLIAAFTDDDVVLAHSRSVRLEDGKLKYHKASLQHHFEGSDTRRFFFFNHIMGHDSMFRKMLVDKIVPFPEGISYDWWIAVVATCYGRIASVKDYLVYHRIHGSNSYFSNTVSSKKKELDIPDTLRLFASIPALDKKSKSYLNELLTLLKEHEKKKGFDAQLFKFLFRNRKIIFGHKRRLFPEWSYVKSAIKYARMKYKGKGMSV